MFDGPLLDLGRVLLYLRAQGVRELARMLTTGRAGGAALLALILACALPAAAGAAVAPHRPGIVLAGFRPGVAAARQHAIERSVGARRIGRAGSALLLRLRGPRVLGAVRGLRRHREVRYAEPDYVMHVAATPDDTSFSQQWWPSAIGAPAAWDVATTSGSVVIGEVDSGIDYHHPDLDANVWINPGGIGGCAVGTRGYNVITHVCDPMDDEEFYGGHGTHVAGILGAVGDNGAGVAGINWKTTILPVKWIDSNGDGSTSGLIAALEWLLQAKAAGVNVRVVNDSITAPGDPFSQPVSDEIDKLGEKGILFVTAAGNTGDDNDTPAKRRYPCGYGRANELCVAATDTADRLPRWTNYGATTVDLAAPGAGVYSTLRNSAYGAISGTSMAAPLVTGTAALVLSRAPTLTPEQLKARILDTVDPLPTLEGLLRSGGRLNVCRALPGCSAAPVPAPDARFGTATIGPNADTLDADHKHVTRYALAQDATVTRLRILLEPGGAAGRQSLRGVIYADAAGRPGGLLATTDAMSYGNGDDRAWWDLRLPSPLALDAGQYWLGVIAGGTTGVARFRWAAGPGARATAADGYADGPSDPFGPVTATDDERMSLYAVFTPRTAPSQDPPSQAPAPASADRGSASDPAPASTSPVDALGSTQASGAPASCAETSRLRTVTAQALGHGLAFSLPAVRGGVTVDVVRVSHGRAVATRRVARFASRHASFTWTGRGVADGLYEVRLSAGDDRRTLALEHRDGRFRARPAYALRARCGAVSRFELSAPAFGGQPGRALGISYRLAKSARADLRLLAGRRTLRHWAARTVRAGSLVGATLPASAARQGDVRAVLRVTAAGHTTTLTLTARRL